MNGNPVTSSHDTLRIAYAGNNTYDYLMDTITVGDTVTFKLILNAVTNNLVAFSLTQSDSISSKTILPPSSSLNTIFVEASSNYARGAFVFEGKHSLAYFTFMYVAKAASTNSILYFSLQSDAKLTGTSGSNNVYFSIKTPIVAKKIE